MAIAGNNVWVADVGPGPGDAHLVHIDAQTNATTVTPVPTGNICAGVAADGAGVWAAAGCDDDHVTRFDPATGAVVTRVDVNKDGNGMAAGVAIGFGSIWVTALQNNFGGANSIARIDPATNKVVARTSLPDAPDVVQVGDGVLWIDVGKTVVRFTPAGAG